MISLVKKDYDSTKIYRKTQKKGASQTYDTPSLNKKECVEHNGGNDKPVFKGIKPGDVIVCCINIPLMEILNTKYNI